MSRDILVFAVSGFLGQASDWSEIQKKLKPSIELKSVDLFSDAHPENLSFLDCITSELQKFSDTRKKTFLGYSFGGRLGLKLLQQNSNLFERWVFISTGAGFPNDALAERQQRLQADKTWAQKISHDNWSIFLKDWNSQSVFQHSQNEPERNSINYSLHKLQKALTDESLALQPDMRDVIKQNKKKILWITGSDDIKYLKQAEELLQHNYIEDSLIIKGGHRLTFDAPAELAEVLNSRLK